MDLSKVKDLRVVGDSFKVKDYLKRAGLYWYPEEKKWGSRSLTLEQCRYLDDLRRRYRIGFEIGGRKYATPMHLLEDTKFEIPLPEIPEIDVCVPDGVTPYPYQLEGARFLLSRGHALLADEMGLGKTAQALLALGTLVRSGRASNCVIVAPSSVLGHWQREIERFSPNARELVTLIGWGMLSRKRELPSSIDLLIVDECHYAKNPLSIRGRNFLELTSNARRCYLLSGTPFLNRPIELFPVLKALDHELASNWERYVETYCSGYQDQYGWHTEGASNLQLLAQKLSGCFIRRCKSEVLQSLPAKIRTLYCLDPDSLAVKRLLKAELFLAQGTGDDDIDQAFLEAKEQTDLSDMTNCAEEFESLAAVRKTLAIQKARLVVAHVKDLLETVDKVVIFWHHKIPLIDCYDKLLEYSPVMIKGDMDREERQQSIDAFQNGDARIILLTFGAGAEGITLTAANVVVMGECIWTPGKMLQAEDRCHRIGQKDVVEVHYLLWDQSVDAMIARVACRKAFDFGVVFSGERFEL